MYDIIAILIPIVLAICAVIAFRIGSDAAVIKKLATTQTEPDAIRLMLLSVQHDRSRGLVTWALLLLAVGFALTLVGWLQLDAEDPLAFGLVLLGAGIGIATAAWAGRQRGPM